MKKEMMKKALEMGIEMGAAGCVMVVTAEEMEILAGMQEEAEENESVVDTLVEQALVQEYVNQVSELLTKIENLGYDITDDSGNILNEIEINFYDKMVEIF
jgi:hypothetical protein